ncbi:DUF1320 domain-containing protein [Acinetobacter stercoris]|uniref:DUF1320 domain-containing protein n=1 Tax=Acinetobacter stercoris TaxID=2126983 RepID=A0A2U3MY36_9GAMM|nr:DUF1320 domain-containing protein [Acinetobacter stercoris]SPL70311.1 hypothetical protein KPC_1489 [Acinetobacter stercoris]
MYATEQDLYLRFGQEIENLKSMLPEESSIEEILQDAIDEINGHIGGRYSLPLPNVPTNLKRMACDIARYRLYFQKPSEEVRQRYEDAIYFLKRVADNKAHLQIISETDQTIIDDQPKNAPATMPIGTTYKGGMFNDAVLDMMPSIK